MKNNIGKPDLAFELGDNQTLERDDVVQVYVNQTDEVGNTALHRACEQGLVETVHFLLESPGIKIYKANDFKETALHVACNAENFSEAPPLIVRLMLAKSTVGINDVDNNGYTALRLLFNSSYKISQASEIMKLLLRHGADPNVTDANKNSVLHRLAKFTFSSKQLITALVAAGVNVNASNSDGKTALDLIADTHSRYTAIQIAKSFIYLTLLENSGEIASNFEKTRELLANFELLAQFKREVKLMLSVFSKKSLYQFLLSNDEASAIEAYKNSGTQIAQRKALEHFAVTYPEYSSFFLKIKKTLEWGKVAWSITKDEATEVLSHSQSQPRLPPELWRKIASYCDPNTLLALKLIPGTKTSALLSACACDNKVIAGLILASRPMEEEEDPLDVNRQDGNGDTALHSACRRGSIELVKLLTDRLDIDLQKADKQGDTALDIAWKNNSSEAKIIRLLLSKKKRNANAADSSHVTLLRLACRLNDPRTVKFLLKKPDIDLNTADSYGQTPLHLACGQPKLGPASQIVSVLLAHKTINVNATNSYGQTPLHTAGLNYCNNNTRSKRPQQYAIIVKLLQYPTIDVNRPDSNQQTLLHSATLRNSITIIALLLENPNIKVNQLDSSGNAALHLACQHNNIYSRTLKALLESPEVDINKLNKNGDTALHLACLALTERAIKVAILLEKDGIEINQCNALGNTALHTLADADCDSGYRKNIYKKTCTLLVEAGVDVNAKNNDRQTALDLAIAEKKYWNAEFLICLTLLKYKHIESEFSKTNDYLNKCKKLAPWKSQTTLIYDSYDAYEQYKHQLKQGISEKAALAAMVQKINFRQVKKTKLYLPIEKAFRIAFPDHTTTPVQNLKSTETAEKIAEHVAALDARTESMPSTSCEPTVFERENNHFFSSSKPIEPIKKSILHRYTAAITLKRTWYASEKEDSKIAETAEKIAEHVALEARTESMPSTSCEPTVFERENNHFFSSSKPIDPIKKSILHRYTTTVALKRTWCASEKEAQSAETKPKIAKLNKIWKVNSGTRTESIVSTFAIASSRQMSSSFQRDTFHHQATQADPFR